MGVGSHLVLVLIRTNVFKINKKCINAVTEYRVLFKNIPSRAPHVNPVVKTDLKAYKRVSGKHPQIRNEPDKEKDYDKAGNKRNDKLFQI